MIDIRAARADPETVRAALARKGAAAVFDELLDWAGFGVAVANAHEDVLRRADLVVPSVQEEGVAVLLEAYLDSTG